MVTPMCSKTTYVIQQLLDGRVWCDIKTFSAQDANWTGHELGVYQRLCPAHSFRAIRREVTETVLGFDTPHSNDDGY